MLDTKRLIMIAVKKRSLTDKEIAGFSLLHKPTGKLFDVPANNVIKTLGKNLSVRLNYKDTAEVFIIENLFYDKVKGVPQITGGRAGAIDKYPVIIPGYNIYGAGCLTLLYKYGTGYVFSDGSGKTISLTAQETISYVRSTGNSLTNAKLVSRPQLIISLLLGDIEQKELPKSKPQPKQNSKLIQSKTEKPEIAPEDKKDATKELYELLTYLEAASSASSYDSIMLAVVQHKVYSLDDMQSMDKESELLTAIEHMEAENKTFTEATESVYGKVLSGLVNSEVTLNADQSSNTLNIV